MTCPDQEPVLSDFHRDVEPAIGTTKHVLWTIQHAGDQGAFMTLGIFEETDLTNLKKIEKARAAAGDARAWRALGFTAELGNSLGSTEES